MYMSTQVPCAIVRRTIPTWYITGVLVMEVSTHIPCAMVQRTIGIWIITDVSEYSSPMCYSPADNRYMDHY